MKLLDLFSGIGGFSLGLEKAGFETIAFCEIEPYAQKVLKKHWSQVPIATDVTKLIYREGVLYDGEREIFRGTIDAICGGFPCQDISVAGNQKGIGEGTRSGLWSECARLVGEIRPKYAIFENVTALLSGDGGRWFQRVLWDISQVGYDAEWHCIPASELGAHHHRDRVWIISYPNSDSEPMCSIDAEQGDGLSAYPSSAGERRSPESGKPVDDREVDTRLEQRREQRSSEIFPDTNSERQQRQGQLKQSIFAKAYKEGKTIGAFASSSSDIWSVEPDVCGGADGISKKLDKNGIIDHDSFIIAANLLYGLCCYADAEKVRPREILFDLWRFVGSETVRIIGEVGGQEHISQAESLLTILREYQKIPEVQNHLFPESEKAFERILRIMRYKKSPSGSPCRPGHYKQRSRQYTDTLQILSRILAQTICKIESSDCREDAQNYMKSLSYEFGVARVCHGVPNRSHRLRCLGNAVVPQIPELIGSAIMEVLND